ncbi:carbon-nitrogen family hydrolase [Streptomyces sp. WAC 00631]|uniref:carbon-nitrogen family hydrolase n=1 Tax=unclassified Streptomyces TaxID=2593676 RepID=UPI000F7987C8|nr:MULTISPECIES: carbon-nitrogen family hydrolase [unclassified Streptomyces]MCC5032458.1 carbon-nitrogen family hydrolase [Streptomyces sp. WAC 00631]MCC9740562.1 carbon-nitrogen family hydrolase [Streptomyces sp. MNU89]
MRASLLQIAVNSGETVAARRERVASLVREQAGSDLVVLPELWPTGAFAYELFEEYAETLDGPTVTAMAAAAAEASVWLHAGSVVERAPDGTLYNTSVVLGPDGGLRASYRKIHRFGFDKGEAALMGGGEEIATIRLPETVAGLATCYDLRFPEQFRQLTDAGAELLVIPAGWPARRREHWTLLARARAVENQAYVLACCSAGTHGGVEQAGHSRIIDPWGEVIAEAGEDEQILTADLDLSRVAKTRADFPVLRDRVLGLPDPRPGTRGA